MLELKQKYMEYVSYYNHELSYDSYYPEFISESNDSVTFYFIADAYPDEIINESDWSKNGFYTVHLLDVPFETESEHKCVTLIIKIQKWIRKDRTVKKRINSPLSFADLTHNATTRVIRSLSEDVKKLPCAEIQTKYGVTESFVSLISKEVVKNEIRTLSYLKHPEFVKSGYISKEKLGDTCFYMFFVIDEVNKTISLAEWERTSSKLFKVLSSYSHLDVIHVNKNIGNTFLKRFKAYSYGYVFDILLNAPVDLDSSLYYIEERNWRHLPRISHNIQSRLFRMTSQMKMNRLHAKKNMYRIIYGNLSYEF